MKGIKVIFQKLGDDGKIEAQYEEVFTSIELEQKDWRDMQAQLSVLFQLVMGKFGLIKPL